MPDGLSRRAAAPAAERRYTPGRSRRAGGTVRRAAGALLLVLALGTLNASAQGEAQVPAAEDPEVEPFDTDRGVAERLLRLPATILDWVATPIGAVYRWEDRHQVHQRLIGLFLNEERTAGFYPRFQAGGSRTFVGGVGAFHSDAFGRGHTVQASVLYAAADSYEGSLRYEVPPTQGRRASISVEGRLNVDPEENFFEIGDDGGAAERLFYGVEEGRLRAEGGMILLPQLFLTAEGGFRRTHIASAEVTSDDPAARPLPAGTAGLGRTHLLHLGAAAVLDLREGDASGRRALVGRATTKWDYRKRSVRTLRGPLFGAALQYFQEPTASRYRFVRYQAEWQQFVPIPLLPPDRRLAFRMLLNKRVPVAGAAVPFYELSVLGGNNDLRGFPHARFRDEGSLLINLEYRYPIWDTWDAVLFLDEGQVFDRYADLSIDGFRPAVGAGIRVMSTSSFLFRVEVARSAEGTRGLLEFERNF